MSKRDLTILICKLIAFLLAVNTVTDAFVRVSMLLVSPEGNESIQTLTRTQSIFELIAKFCVIIVCIFLWFKAEPIAARFVSDATPSSILVIDDSLAAPVIALAGIVIFILAIWPFYLSISNRFIPSEFGVFVNKDAMIDMVTAVFQMALGVGMFFGAKGISQKLRNRICDEGQTQKYF